MNEKQYKYFALIVFVPGDERHAVQLKKFLSSYHLPSRIRKRFPHLPERFENIEANEASAVCNEVADARYIIPVCSSRTVQSEDFRRCVSQFIEGGEDAKDRTIAILFRNENERPSSCMPAIITENVLAADIIDKGRERVYNDIIAKLLGLEPDELWDRHLREQKRKARRRLTFGCALSLMAVAGGWYAYDYYTPHHRYYQDYIEINNIPQGIGEMEETDLVPGSFYYIFTEQKRRLVRVSASQHRRKLHPLGIETVNNAFSDIMLSYRDNGEVQSTRNIVAPELYLLNAMWTTEYLDPDTVTICDWTGKNPISVSRCKASDTYLPEARMKAKVSQYILVRDDLGRVARKQYITAGKAPGTDEKGVSVEEYEYNADNRVVKVRRYNKHMIELPGMLTSYGYDADGMLVAATDPEGRGTIRMEYDRQRRLVKYWLESEDGQTAAPDDPSVAYRTLSYGSDGRTITVTNHGPGGEEIDSNDESGDRIARWVYQCDDRGNVSDVSYYNTAGAPATSNGAHHIQMSYNALGQMVSIRSFDSNDTPCESQRLNMNARIDLEYNEQGNISRMSFFNAGGQPPVEREACREIGYDERGNMSVYRVLNGKNELTEPEAHLVCDAYGNHLEQWATDKNGEMTTTEQGCAQTAIITNERGEDISVSCFDKNGLPRPNGQGIFKSVFHYDEKGRVTETVAFTLQSDMSGYSGNFLTGDGTRPASRVLPCYSVNSKYDQLGRVVGIEVRDLTYEGVLSRTPKYAGGLTFVSQRLEYEGKETEPSVRYFFGPNGEPGGKDKVYMLKRRKLSVQGKEYVGSVMFDKDGHPMQIRQPSNQPGAVGEYHSVDRSNRTEEIFYADEQDNILPAYGGNACIAQTLFDERQRPVRLSLLDKERKPAENSDGLGSQYTTYDSSDRQESISYFDKQNAPCEISMPGMPKFHRVEFSYDAAGRQSIKALYNSAGNVIR